MDNSKNVRNSQRFTRRLRVRKKLRGSAEKPRMSVFKSNRHLSIQLIDDEAGKTLVALSTVMPEMRKQKLVKSKEAATTLGQKIAEQALAKNIQRVVFDRGHYKYHGLIAQLADSARKAGLQF
ncbi:MAG: 50S ribosomal protein L18 [Verrucomicrobia bacterium]|nr:50S ribosomal protein L18 [Verrucomicrobiota bacterium]